jgi:hypothetical protein
MLHEQDLYIILKLFVMRDEHWTFSSLSQNLSISTSQIHLGLSRAETSGLYNSKDRRVHRKALGEFVLHGVRYSFPAVPGKITRGLPTSFAAFPLKERLLIEPESIIPVWPDPEGEAKGYRIDPLHPNAPAACRRDPAFYEVLALVDLMREGRARERNMAEHEIAHRFEYWR